MQAQAVQFSLFSFVFVSGFLCKIIICEIFNQQFSSVINWIGLLEWVFLILNMAVDLRVLGWANSKLNCHWAALLIIIFNFFFLSLSLSLTTLQSSFLFFFFFFYYFVYVTSYFKINLHTILLY